MAQVFNAKIEVRLKDGVLDPQGAAIESALGSLGFSQAHAVRQGKLIEMTIEATDEGAANALAREMCTALLANTVIENFDIQLEAVAG